MKILTAIALILFSIGIALQIICTAHELSLLLLGASSLLLILLKDRPMKKDKCNGTCEYCECNKQGNEQHHEEK